MDWQSTKVVMMLLRLLHLGQDGQNHGFGVQGSFLIQAPPAKVYARLGDINIGVLDSQTFTWNETFPCSVRRTYDFRYAEVLAYAVEQINKKHILPNNLTLGFILLDDCGSSRVIAKQALAFVPQPDCPDAGSNSLRYYDVVAVMGSRTSDLTMTAAKILKTANMPQISFYATNDILSDYKRFPNILRNISPDRYQAQTIVDVINKFGWNYVQIVYRKGSFGQLAIRRFTHLLKRAKICTAADMRLGYTYNKDELEIVAKKLVEHHSRARVVVAFLDWSSAFYLIRATRQLLPGGTFIWIGIDGWTSGVGDMKGVNHLLLDSLLVETPEAYVPEFADWFAQQTPNGESSPWFRDDWEDVFNCSFDDGTCNNTQTVREANFTKIGQSNRMGYIVDAVNMIANGISRILQQPRCHHLRGSAARDCVTSEQLLREMKTAQLNGTIGLIQINKYGDLRGVFDVWQIQADSTNQHKKVKVFESFYEQKIIKVTNKVIWTEDNLPPGLLYPVSRCSLPCPARHARIVTNVSCCWVCRECDDMQRVVHEGQTCETCPDFTWPDPPFYDKCIPAPESRLRFDNWKGMFLTTGASLAILVCIAIFFFFCYHRQSRLLQATCRALSCINLFGVIIGCVTIMIFLTYPSDTTCQLQYVLLCISVNMTNGSMLVRAFHIWLSIKRDPKAPPPNNETRRQLLLAFALLFVQAMICSFEFELNTLWYERHQFTEKNLLVELTCITSVFGLAAFTVYNFLLVVLCTIFAFVTRNMEDNYYESYFIFRCTCFILVLSLCIIPAHLITQQELQKRWHLLLFLFINNSGVIIFQFLTKVYALWHNLDRNIEVKIKRESPCVNPTSSSATISSKDNIRTDASPAWSSHGNQSCIRRTVSFYQNDPASSTGARSATVK